MNEKSTFILEKPKTLEEERSYYLKIQRLIFGLQTETWPFENIDRTEAFNEIVVFGQKLGVEFDPLDPDFLSALQKKVFDLLSAPIQQEVLTIPPNLKEMVEIYEEAKQKDEIEKEKLLGKNKILYKQIKVKVKETLLRSEKISQNQPLLEDLSSDLAEKIISKIEPVSKQELYTQNEFQKIIQPEETIAPPPDEKEFRNIPTDNIILEKFKELGINPPENITQELIQETFPISQKIATSPELMTFFKESRVSSQKGEIKTIDISSLPPEIIQKLNQSNTPVGFSPADTIFYPKAWVALGQKVIVTPRAKLLKLGLNEIPEQELKEWRQMAQQGIFTEDLQTTLEALEKMGLKKDHPIFPYLKDKINRFYEVQKIPIKNKAGKIIGWKDNDFAKVFKNYYRYNKITGKLSIKDEQSDIHLLNSPGKFWGQGGYGGSLKNLLDRFRILPRLYEKTFKFITKGKYSSFGNWTQKVIYPKFIKPILVKLGKTAIGKAVKTAAKKVVAKLAVKAGVKLGIRAASIAAAPESFGISLLVAALIEAGTWIIRKAVGWLKRLIHDPEKALQSILAGGLVLVILPMPIALIGVLPLALGVGGLAGFGFSSVGLKSIGGGTSGAFSALSGTSFSLPIVPLLTAIFGATIGLTIFIVMVVSGAFILPNKTTQTPFYEKDFFTVEKIADPNQIDNGDLAQNPFITYHIRLRPQQSKKVSILSIREKIDLIYDTNSGKQLSINGHSFEQDLKEKGKEINDVWETTYQVQISPGFEDTAIINTVTVEAVVEGESGSFEKSATAVVIVGNPPDDCPYPWPLANVTEGMITSVPFEIRIINGQIRPHRDAIDIAAPLGTPVFATHRGIILAKGYDSGRGNFVLVEGFCNGHRFYSSYYHLSSIDSYIKVGAPVFVQNSQGERTILGKVGSTGFSTGSHLHYEFSDPKIDPDMKVPFVPEQWW